MDESFEAAAVRKGLYSKIGIKPMNMTQAAEKKALRRILETVYHKIYPQYMNLFLLQEKFFKLAEENIKTDIASFKNDPQAVRRFLYGRLDWNQREIDVFEDAHATQTTEDFITDLIVETYEALYDSYLTPYEVTQEPKTADSRNRFPRGKQKSLRKDRSQSIADADVSESELAELKQRKAFHEAWAAFHAAHRGPIESDLSPQDHARLKREIFQHINANVKELPTPAQMWKKNQTKPYLLLEAEAIKNGKIIINIRKELVMIIKKLLPFKNTILQLLFPKAKNVKTFLDSRVITYLGRQQGLINTLKDVKNVNNARTRLNKMEAAWAGFQKEREAKVFFQREMQLLKARNNTLLNYWDSMVPPEKKSRAHFLTAQEARNVIFW